MNWFENCLENGLWEKRLRWEEPKEVGVPLLGDETLLVLGASSWRSRL